MARPTYVDTIAMLSGSAPMPTTPASSYAPVASSPQATGAANLQTPTTTTQAQTTNPQTTTTPLYSSSSQTQAPTTEPGQPYSLNLREYGGNPEIRSQFASLFKPITSSLQTASKGLVDTAGGFISGAGPRRTFTSLGGEGALGEILTGKRPEEEGKSLVTAKYTGPTELDQTALGALRAPVQELEARQKSLRTPLGVQNLLQQSSPGLTPGEAKLETSRLRANPEFQKSAAAASTDIGQFLADFNRSQEQAKAIAAQRAADEAEIASKSQDWLLSQGGALEAAWDEAVKKAHAENLAAAEALGKFQQTGTIEDLAKLGPALQFDPLAFNTPVRQNVTEGQAARQAILDKYSGIKDIPLMTLQTTSKGRETLGFDPEWWNANKDKYSPAEMSSIKEQARARQKELEAAGFSGGQYWKSRYTSVTPDAKYGAQAGKYSETLPLYFGTDFTPADIRNYVGDLQLMSPTRQNVSTSDQRATYNRIQRIMSAIEGSANEIEDPEYVFQAAQVMADVGKYLEDETAAMSEQKGTLAEGQRQWREQVRAARKRYEKLKKAGIWKKAAIGIGALVTGGLAAPAAFALGGTAAAPMATAVGSATGAGLGKSIATGA